MGLTDRFPARRLVSAGPYDGPVPPAASSDQSWTAERCLQSPAGRSPRLDVAAVNACGVDLTGAGRGCAARCVPGSLVSGLAGLRLEIVGFLRGAGSWPRKEPRLATGCGDNRASGLADRSRSDGAARFCSDTFSARPSGLDEIARYVCCAKLPRKPVEL